MVIWMINLKFRYQVCQQHITHVNYCCQKHYCSEHICVIAFQIALLPLNLVLQIIEKLSKQVKSIYVSKIIIRTALLIGLCNVA